MYVSMYACFTVHIHSDIYVYFCTQTSKTVGQTGRYTDRQIRMSTVSLLTACFSAIELYITNGIG